MVKKWWSPLAVCVGTFMLLLDITIVVVALPAAVALGPILGGIITSGISWRGIFLVNVPLGASAIAVKLARLDELRPLTPGDAGAGARGAEQPAAVG